MKYGKAGFPETIVTAKDIIIATGSVPFVPKGIEVDGKNLRSFVSLILDACCLHFSSYHVN